MITNTYNWTDAIGICPEKHTPYSYDKNGIQRDEFGKTKEEWKTHIIYDKKNKAKERENLKNGINNVQFYYKKNGQRFGITPYKSIKVLNKLETYDGRNTNEYKYLLNEYLNERIECFDYFNYTLNFGFKPYSAFHRFSIYENEKYKNSNDKLDYSLYLEYKKAKENAIITNPHKFKEIETNVFSW